MYSCDVAKCELTPHATPTRAENGVGEGRRAHAARASRGATARVASRSEPRSPLSEAALFSLRSVPDAPVLHTSREPAQRNAQRAMQRAPERQPAPQSASSEGRRRTRYARRGSKTTPYSRIGADSESPLSLPIRGSYDALLLHKVQDEATHSHGDRKHQEQHIHGMLPSPCGRQRNVDPDR